MLKQPSHDIPVEITEDSVIWNKTRCPIILRLNEGTSHESLTFFMPKYAKEARAILDSNHSLEKNYTIESMDNELIKEFSPLFLMRMAKKEGRIIGFIDIPLAWLLGFVQIQSSDLDDEDLQHTIQPSFEYLTQQMQDMTSDKLPVPDDSEDDETEVEDDTISDE